MRSFYAVYIGCAIAVCGGAAESFAADSGQTVVRAAYATYFRQGFTAKDVVAFKPYFESGLYALTAHWAKAPRRSGRMGFECMFDSDPFSNAQNGRPTAPLTIGVPTTAGGRTTFPVAITLKFQKGSMASHVLVPVVEVNGRYRIWDIVPVINGKAYAAASLRANLTHFMNGAACR